MPGGNQASSSYPLVLLAHKNLDQSRSWGDDMTQILATLDAESWTATRRFSTPTNTSGIVQIAPAVNYHGHGVFVLYRTADGELRVYGEFMKPDQYSSDGNVFIVATDVKCPSGKFSTLSD